MVSEDFRRGAERAVREKESPATADFLHIATDLVEFLATALTCTCYTPSSERVEFKEGYQSAKEALDSNSKSEFIDKLISDKKHSN